MHSRRGKNEGIAKGAGSCCMQGGTFFCNGLINPDEFFLRNRFSPALHTTLRAPLLRPRHGVLQVRCPVEFPSRISRSGSRIRRVDFFATLPRTDRIFWRASTRIPHLYRAGIQACRSAGVGLSLNCGISKSTSPASESPKTSSKFASRRGSLLSTSFFTNCANQPESEVFASTARCLAKRQSSSSSVIVTFI